MAVVDTSGEGYLDVGDDNDLLNYCKDIKVGDVLDIYVEHGEYRPNVGGNYVWADACSDEDGGGGPQGENVEIPARADAVNEAGLVGENVQDTGIEGSGRESQINIRPPPSNASRGRGPGMRGGRPNQGRGGRGGRGERNGPGQRYGCFVEESTCRTILNPGTSTERVINQGEHVDASVTGIDLGFKPRGLKWKGKTAMTTSQLQNEALMGKRKGASISNSNPKTV